MASFAKSTTNKTTNKYSQHIIQNKSEQDYAISGSTPDFDFMVIADSHGYGYNKDYYTQMFSGINWNEFLTGNWRENLMTMCNHKLNSNRIGTTFTCVKITPEYFEVTWIGDSSAKIYKNNELLWQTKDHNYDNNEDIEKLKLTEKAALLGEIPPPGPRGGPRGASESQAHTTSARLPGGDPSSVLHPN